MRHVAAGIADELRMADEFSKALPPNGDRPRVESSSTGPWKDERRNNGVPNQPARLPRLASSDRGAANHPPALPVARV